MVTKEQALTANEFHMDGCSRIIGPRGGIKQNITAYRRTGATKTWVTRPDQFRVPVIHGMYARSGAGYITDYSARDFHTAPECPIIDACCSCASFGPDGWRDTFCFCKCHTI